MEPTLGGAAQLFTSHLSQLKKNPILSLCQLSWCEYAHLDRFQPPAYLTE